AYAWSLLAFSAVTQLATYAIQRLQGFLPLNPQRFGPVEAGSAFNTAASFTTNTNWQGYSGEATMSYFTQIARLARHTFLAPAGPSSLPAGAGIAVAVALARGLTRRGDGSTPGTIGNFWLDLTRSIVYVLLPASLLFALIFVSQGMIQNFHSYQVIRTLEGG